MTPGQEKQIQKIMEEIECPFDFKCYKTGFATIYEKLKNIGLEDFLDSTERFPPSECIYSIRFGFSYLFCYCPLALYVVKNRVKM